MIHDRQHYVFKQNSYPGIPKEPPKSAHLDKIHQNPGGIITNYDSDPFHYSFEELSWMASISGLEVKLVGDWNHPRNQKMAAFFIR